MLRASLPQPPSGDQEDIARRERVALATVASLAPVNADEAGLAVLCVVTGAHADECLRLAVQYAAADPKFAAKLRAQYASMGREARSCRAALLRAQATRRKREANDATRESAAHIERSVLALMTEAMQSITALPPAAPAAKPPARPPLPPQPRDDNDLSKEGKQRERPMSEAERYAVYNARRVELIRQLGGVPLDRDFQPPRRKLLH